MAIVLPDFSNETRLMGRGHTGIIGIDEAGRGAWAGPVVAGAVRLDPAAIPAGIRDSKTLPEARREALFAAISAVAEVGVGAASVAEIDQLGIGKATLLSMARAADAFGPAVTAALVDGNVPPALPTREVVMLVRGDSHCLSIAAASIIAKVTRDRIMRALANDVPAYAWDKNKGYGAAAHALGLARHGVTAHHRTSFKPVRIRLSQPSAPFTD